MHVILLSGGMGKRLWPLSDKRHPKQFLKLFPGPNGHVSMAQRVHAQLKQEGLAGHSIICAGQEQEQLLKSQLGDIPVVLEPEPRDTFPAIALSCAYLLSEKHASDDDPVVVLPVDPYVDTDYFDAVKSLPALLTQTQSQIVLMGKTPTGPDVKYGYILPGQETDGILEVSGFHEKPTPEKARELLAMGALWNIGVFCFKLGLIRQWLSEYQLEADYPRLYNAFDQLPSKSFDYQVLEHSSQIAALRFEGVWRDLGTWCELSEVLPQTCGRCIEHECEKTFLFNSTRIPVIAIGIRNAVVVVTENGILISDCDRGQNIKEVDVNAV